MKRKTIERRRGKIGTYGLRRSEQLRGVFRSVSPFILNEFNGMPFEKFKIHKKGKINY